MLLKLLAALLVAQSATAADLPRYESEVSEPVLAIVARLKSNPDDSLLAELERLSDAGDESATELLGEIYLGGLFGLEADPARACDYFERSANARPDSAHNFATCLFSGDGRPRDHAAARHWYARAAKGGWVTARCGLGNMLIRGQGGEAEVERGLEMCLSAAQLGDKDAQTDYGGYLLMGKATERDPVSAREWLMKAGEQGQANAAYLLGQIFTKGDGIPADDRAAEHWFRRAHDGGRPDAAWQLALALTRRGYRNEGGSIEVAPAILSEAMAWARIAATNDPEAENRESAEKLVPALKALIEKAKAG